MPAGIFDSSSGTIWNNNNGYQVPSASELANSNSFGQNLLDPTGLVAGLWNDITGITSQSREFSQQEYLQDKMNAYNHPVEQMKRAKEAGINPNLAAAGIAQAGSQSAQAPAVSSNTSGVASGVGSVASMFGGVGSLLEAGIAKSLAPSQIAETSANASKLAAEAAEIHPSAVAGRGLMRAQQSAALASAGLDEATRSGILIQNQYLGLQSQMDILNKVQNFRFMEESIRNEHQRFENLRSEVTKNYSEAKLNFSSSNLVEQQAITEKYKQDMLSLDNQEKEWDKSFREFAGFKVGIPSDTALTSILFNPKLSSEQKILRADAIGDAISLPLKYEMFYELKKYEGMTDEDIRKSWNMREASQIGVGPVNVKTNFGEQLLHPYQSRKYGLKELQKSMSN